LTPEQTALIETLETLIHQDVGRNIKALMAATQGNLARAANALAHAKAVGILTGFFVPYGELAAAETDGPVGAALVARALSTVGIGCHVLTDDRCRAACEVALSAAVAPILSLTALRHECEAPAIRSLWETAGVTCVLAIERCGRTADGTLRNMRGQDISAYGVPLDRLVVDCAWHTIAIGDGGNELGMGALPPGLVAAHVTHGDCIACVTPVDHMVTAGVSHWGAWALIAALAVVRPDWRLPLLACLDPSLDRVILETMVAHGPAVDGVSLRRAPTIDGLDITVHHRKLSEIRAILQR
jgi:hypothetical protein